MITRISYGDEFLDVDTEDIGELESAMRFKAEYIKAKAEPELFEAVADALSGMWDRCVKAIETADRTEMLLKKIMDIVDNKR